jgi:hypothetical protein
VGEGGERWPGMTGAVNLCQSAQASNHNESTVIYSIEEKVKKSLKGGKLLTGSGLKDERPHVICTGLLVHVVNFMS